MLPYSIRKCAQCLRTRNRDLLSIRRVAPAQIKTTAAGLILNFRTVGRAIKMRNNPSPAIGCLIHCRAGVVFGVSERLSLSSEVPLIGGGNESLATLGW